MTNHLEEEIRALVAGMDNQENQDSTDPKQQDIQDVYVLIVREHGEIEDTAQVVDSSPKPATTQQDSFLSAYLFVCCSVFLVLSILFFQLYCMMNPLIATVTIIPTSQHITLSGIMQLGRVLAPLTISQSQTTPATGKGHQDAQAATGYITFYNGQFQSVTVAAGTILRGLSGIQVVTDQDASIPPGNPGTGYGRITVSAHAIIVGSSGNIAAYDINQACCTTSVLAVNLTSFHGGQDERSYTTVTQSDIHSISTVLKTTLERSIQGALQGQLQLDEQLQLLPCSPSVTSDHQQGEEATQVKVTVSETCSAIAYNSQELQTKATTYLATQAQQKAGAGYSLFGTPQIHIVQATVSSTTPHLVFLSFTAIGSWIYGISHQSQEQIKYLIAGKTTEQAQQLLAKLPGVAQATIHFSGFGDTTRIPKTIGYIHINLIVM